MHPFSLTEIFIIGQKTFSKSASFPGLIGNFTTSPIFPVCLDFAKLFDKFVRFTSTRLIRPFVKSGFLIEKHRSKENCDKKSRSKVLGGSKVGGSEKDELMRTPLNDIYDYLIYHYQCIFYKEIFLWVLGNYILQI